MPISWLATSLKKDFPPRAFMGKLSLVRMYGSLNDCRNLMLQSSLVNY